MQIQTCHDQHIGTHYLPQARQQFAFAIVDMLCHHGAVQIEIDGIDGFRLRGGHGPGQFLVGAVLRQPGARLHDAGRIFEGEDDDGGRAGEEEGGEKDIFRHDDLYSSGLIRVGGERRRRRGDAGRRQQQFKWAGFEVIEGLAVVRQLQLAGDQSRVFQLLQAANAAGPADAQVRAPAG